MVGFDFGEVAENTANKTIERALQCIYEPIATKVGRTRTAFFEDFSVYFRHMFQKCAFVRTILSKNKSEHISSLYVPVTFHCNGDKRLDSEIVKKIRNLERIVIRGNGGSGKTIFFKYLWLSIFSDTQGKIPLFVELRRFNEVKTPNLKAFCRLELQSKAIFSDTVFESLCADGKFIFIFDGFDELDASIRVTVEKQIIEMSYNYRECGFAVSSRDDDRFGSWQDFKVYTVSSLSLVEVRNLVEKIDFDSRTKKKFLDDLNEVFFQRHAQFLSSPLLTTMMLMTFYQNASIPNRITTFYSSAFQTMMLWHDATKDSFERERLLSLEDFRILFSIFCLLTYYKQNHDFDESELRSAIQKAIAYGKKIEKLSHLSDTHVELVKNGLLAICELASKRRGHLFFSSSIISGILCC